MYMKTFFSSLVFALLLTGCGASQRMYTVQYNDGYFNDYEMIYADTIGVIVRAEANRMPTSDQHVLRVPFTEVSGIWQINNKAQSAAIGGILGGLVVLAAV